MPGQLKPKLFKPFSSLCQFLSWQGAQILFSGANSRDHILRSSLPLQHGSKLENHLLKSSGFKEAVPRYAFILWLAMKERLTTRDRLIQWGMNIPSGCVLCSSGEDSHSHLFFECEFSRQTWFTLAHKISPNPPLTLHSASAWVMRAQSSPQYYASIILKMLLQATTYVVWQERNSRVFNAQFSTTAAIIAQLDHTLRNRLISFRPEDPLSSLSLIAYYFGCIERIM